LSDTGQTQSDRSLLIAVVGVREIILIQMRSRVDHTAFEERLANEAIKFREAAEKQPPGSKARELLLRRARQADTASHINNWLSSPGLQPPKALEHWAKDQKR
jgi:hypothetical protein